MKACVVHDDAAAHPVQTAHAALADGVTVRLWNAIVARGVRFVRVVVLLAEFVMMGVERFNRA